ncbi:MAG TPA: site-specific DNA-methyltransferase [Pyrinomonadaceae bacterium]
MAQLTDQQRLHIIKLLQTGEDLPPDYQQLLFPPERQEYELLYHGKQWKEDILANTMAVPLQPVRTFGNNGDGWHNKLIFGDNLQVIKKLIELKAEGTLCNSDGTPGVRLIYIDPPFGTGDQYGPRDGEFAYTAKIQGARFMEFLRKRLVLMRELLASNGSIYVRLDYHFGHYIKVIMDEVFGLENFQNEIVINRFKRQLSGLNKFNVSTDCLFFYSRSGKPLFNEQKRSRLCSFCGQEKDPEWHHMVSSGLRNPPERVILGRLLYPPRTQHWKYTQSNIDIMERQGRIRINEKTSYTDIHGNRVKGLPEFLQTEDSVVDSDWTDLRGYVLSARYPTENAEELLERVVRTSSNEGDIVLDAFAGSGTALAVAEKLGRRWIGIDSGKLAIYTMQKRMLTLRKEIGNKGTPIAHKPFILYNAGLYDFSTLKHLQWSEWRFFALQLFGCREEQHIVGGLKLDGKLKGASVLVFNHLENPNRRVDEETVQSIHAAVGDKIGRKFYIIAPRGVFDFQQDYIDLDGVRYYALRIPYSFINELHSRKFTALQQPNDERSINQIVDSHGFDFIRPPKVEWSIGTRSRKGQLFEGAFIKVKKFQSYARLKGEDTYGGLETLSMLMLDYSYEGDVFNHDAVYFASQLEDQNWEAHFPAEAIGEKLMAVFIDIHGNEAREVIPREKFSLVSDKQVIEEVEVV